MKTRIEEAAEVFAAAVRELKAAKTNDEAVTKAAEESRLAAHHRVTAAERAVVVASQRLHAVAEEV